MFIENIRTNDTKKKCDRLFSLFKNVTFSSNGHCIWVIIFNVFLLCSVSLSLSFDKWQYILRIRSHPIRWCEDRCIHYILWRVLLLNLLYTAFIFIIIVKMSRIDLKGRFKHFRSVSRCTPHIYIYIYIDWTVCHIEPWHFLPYHTCAHITHWMRSFRPKFKPKYFWSAQKLQSTIWWCMCVVCVVGSIEMAQPIKIFVSQIVASNHMQNFIDIIWKREKKVAHFQENEYSKWQNKPHQTVCKMLTTARAIAATKKNSRVLQPRQRPI